MSDDMTTRDATAVDGVMLCQMEPDSRLYSWALRLGVGTKEDSRTIRATQEEVERLREKIADYDAERKTKIGRAAARRSAAAAKVSGAVEAADATAETIERALNPSMWLSLGARFWSSVQPSSELTRLGQYRIRLEELSPAAMARVLAAAPVLAEKARQREAVEQERRACQEAEWRAAEARRVQEREEKRVKWRAKQEQPRPSIMAAVWVLGDRVRIEWADGAIQTDGTLVAVAGSWLRLSVNSETWIVHMDRVRRAIVTATAPPPKAKGNGPKASTATDGDPSERRWDV